jgi:hypothetical protein
MATEELGYGHALLMTKSRLYILLCFLTTLCEGIDLQTGWVASAYWWRRSCYLAG